MYSKLFTVLVVIQFFIANLFCQTLVWSDEFNGTALNDSIWNYDLGDGCSLGICGWGNSELQQYTNSSNNVRVANGNLIIEATNQNGQINSGRIKTNGKLNFKYGTLEARIKIPDLANGLWPAFWLLGDVSGNWPGIGEIDIAEWGSGDAINNNVVNKRVGGACHWDSFGNYANYGTHTDFPTDLNNNFHVYKLVWTPNSITCFVDNTQYFVIDITNPDSNSLEEFHNMKYILLNLAVGGTYTGIFNSNQITANFPATMEIDYLRLYQDANGELFIAGNDNAAICGNFGIYTETTMVSDQLAIDATTFIYNWNGLNPNSNSSYEGSDVLSYSTIANDWYGFGFATTPAINLSNFSNGNLKFHLKTNAPSTTNFEVGILTNTGEQWITINANNGLVFNNQWHEITLPLSSYSLMNFSSISQTFMFRGNIPTASYNFEIDNIYYEDDIPCNTTCACISNLTLNNNPESTGLYFVDDFISSSSKVNLSSNGNVIYQAGDFYIELINDFEATGEVNFTAEILDCDLAN